MKELLEKHGWTIECESPLEVRHTSGSFLSSNLAYELVNRLELLEPKRKNLGDILDLMDEMGIDQVTFNAHQFDEEYGLTPDDKDWVTFHKRQHSPTITDKLLVCDYETTKVPVYNGWYMTINYHS